MLSKKINKEELERENIEESTYGSRYFGNSIPKYELRRQGMPTPAAYQLIHDELQFRW